MAQANDLAYLYGQIIKRDAATRTVEGYVSSPDTDLDGQIVDQEWLKRELPPWLAQWGNIREQHDPRKAVGRARDIDLTAAPGPYLTARIVDDAAWEKVKAGVYNGFSIGIKGPVVVRDDQARNGRIVGGRLVEISIVDRPANDAARFVLVKRLDGQRGVEEWKDVQTGVVITKAPAASPAEAGTDVAKRDVSQDERERLAGEGEALPDGSFPIVTVEDLRNAVQAVGRAKDPEAARAHIIRRARELGREDLLPEDWRASGAPVGERAETKREQPTMERKAGSAGNDAGTAAMPADAEDRVATSVTPGSPRRPAAIGAELVTVLREALSRLEALARETDRDRDGDVDTPANLQDAHGSRPQPSASFVEATAPEGTPLAERGTLDAAFAGEPELLKRLDALITRRVREIVGGQVVTKAVDSLSAAGSVAKLASHVAQGLETLAGEAEATARELAALKHGLADQQAELERVKELAQPVKGAVFAVEKGIGLEPDRAARLDTPGSERDSLTSLAEKAAQLSEEERLQLARQMYRIASGRSQ